MYNSCRHPHSGWFSVSGATRPQLAKALKERLPAVEWRRRSGYSIGSGQTRSPVVLLKMPVGILIGALCFCCGIFEGVLTARDFSEGNAAWRKRVLAAFGCLFPGVWIISITLF